MPPYRLGLPISLSSWPRIGHDAEDRGSAFGKVTDLFYLLLLTCQPWNAAN
ncbi:hypothetical protein [Candidatus Nanopelagicus hibericus]|uniref:hypothetical protein n=1 Tax=Candidatus Nanopelagicus hibericus TaxID=1884915 RepID=UPI001CC05724|nr:hypothetical protein [Candidatus Nanopelagicus hibericus]